MVWGLLKGMPGFFLNESSSVLYYNRKHEGQTRRVFLCVNMSEALIPSGLLADEGQAEDNLIGGGGAILWQMEAIQSERWYYGPDSQEGPHLAQNYRGIMLLGAIPKCYHA